MRYFFHTIDDGRFNADDEGTELETDDEARQEAGRYAAEWAVELAPISGHRMIGIQVINEAGFEIAAVGFTMETAAGLGSLGHYRRRGENAPA